MAQYHYIPGAGYAEIHFKDGKPLFMANLTDKKAKRFSALGLMIKDIGLVRDALMLLKSGIDNQTIKQSLSFFAIVTYAKCFTEAHGRGTQLQEKDALNGSSETVREEHIRVMEQRHNYVAHGGLKGYEENAIVATLDPESSEIITIQPNIIYLVDIDSQLDNFLLLIDVVDKYLHEAISRTFQSLKDESYKRGFDELIKEAIHPDVDNSVRF